MSFHESQIGPQVETNDDLHLLGEKFKNIALNQDVTDGGNGIEVELRTEIADIGISM